MKRIISRLLHSGVLISAIVMAGCSNDDPRLTSNDNISGGINADEFITHEYSKSELPSYDDGNLLMTWTSPAESRNINARQKEFAASLLKAKSLNENENFAISPLSASIALSIMANGADGETLDEILLAVGGTNATTDDLNRYWKSLIPTLNFKYNEMELMGHSILDAASALANSLWVDRTIPISKSFVSNLKDNYRADIFNLDLNDRSAADIINEWCNDKTYGLIPNAVANPLSSNLSLVNALYFSANWYGEIFKAQNTRTGNFTNADGSQSEVKMMYEELTSQTSYAETNSFECLKIDMMTKTKMVIYLPKKGVTITDNALAEALNAEYENCDAEIELPRFTLGINQDLKELLPSLGIRSLFSQQDANLSKMYDRKAVATNLFVSEARQKNTITVNEEGVVGAAVNIFNSLTSANDGEGDKPRFVVFKVDRPFYFSVQNESGDVIFFIGKVNKL